MPHPVEHAENVNCSTNSTLRFGFLDVIGQGGRESMAGKRVLQMVKHSSIPDRERRQAKKKLTIPDEQSERIKESQ